MKLDIGAGDINPNAAYQPIHPVGDSRVTVSFRDGHEVLEKTKLDPLVRNLDTAGVFGPILGTVLVDAARGNLAWSHWEQGQSGLQAVFSYEVPKEKSHYTITYNSVPTDPEPCNVTPQTFSKVVAYHGKMAVDPASGTILRLILLADLKPDEFAPFKSGIGVEYGPVSIGGKSYFLPIKSVTSSLGHYLFIRGAGGVDSCSWLTVTRSLQTSLNDVVFENYHVFRTDARVLTESEAANFEHQPSPAPNGKGLKQSERANAPPVADTTPATSVPHSRSRAASSRAAVANLANPPAPESQPAQQPVQRIAESAQQPAAASLPAPNQPAQPANSANPDIPDAPVFRTGPRQVLVDVVVDKRNGDPVSGLPQSDFSIAEDGKPRTIDFFEEHSASASPPVAQPAMPPMPPGAVTNVSTEPPSTALNVFLLDSLNSEPQDQVFVHEQVLSYLHKMDPGIQVAVFSLGSGLRLLQGFTSDPSALLAAVSGKVAKRDAMAQKSSDNADDAAHIANLQSVRVSPAAIEARQAADAAAHAYSFGARASMTFEALNSLARYLEGIPGRKNLVWFASSFPVVFFPTSAQLDQLKNNPNLPGYINHVQQTANLFILSKVAVYPVSGAGVMNSNIGLADSADAGSAGGTGHFGTADAPTASLTGEAMNSASALTTMEQLASSTGGRAFTPTTSMPHSAASSTRATCTTLLVYMPTDTTTDSGFRRIDVKVAGGKYKLAYRQGYNTDSASTDDASSEDPIVPLLQLGLPSATGIFFGASVEREVWKGAAQLRCRPRRPEPQAERPAHWLHRLTHHPRSGRLLRPGPERRAHSQASHRSQGLWQGRRRAQLAGQS